MLNHPAVTPFAIFLAALVIVECPWIAWLLWRLRRPASFKRAREYCHTATICGGRVHFCDWAWGDYETLIAWLAARVADEDICWGCALNNLGQIAAAPGGPGFMELNQRLVAAVTRRRRLRVTYLRHPSLDRNLPC